MGHTNRAGFYPSVEVFLGMFSGPTSFGSNGVAVARSGSGVLVGHSAVSGLDLASGDNCIIRLHLWQSSVGQLDVRQPDVKQSWRDARHLYLDVEDWVARGLASRCKSGRRRPYPEPGPLTLMAVSLAGLLGVVLMRTRRAEGSGAT